MLNEMFEEVVPVILHEDDLNAMYFSMENRSPFLDSTLFDLAYSIPSQYLIKDGRAKAVLRDAMRGIVPNVILDERRKVGFNAPILDLLDLNDPDIKDYLLDDSKIYNLVNKDNIEKILKIKVYLIVQVNFYLIF
jgi:asparagine synthase (glutamine-hydrolysing)